MSRSPFPRFVIASGLTNLADGIATLAWAWLASLLTRDPILVALVPVALRLPWAIFAIPAGLLADRIDRRRLILAMDVVRGMAFVMATLALWAALPLSAPPPSGTSNDTLFALIALSALIVGAAEVFRDNAAQTMLPALVPHDRLERANGRLWSVELIGNSLIGPAFGALLLGIAVPLPFAVNAACYGVAFFLILSLTGQFRPDRHPGSNWRAELAEAFSFLIQAPLLRLLAVITGFWNLFFQMMAIAMVLHVQENLGLGPEALGITLACGALGGMAAGLVAERIVARLGPGRTAALALLWTPPSFAMMALAPNIFALAATIALFEFWGLVWNTVSVSYRQRRIPDRMLGRVNSLYRLLAWGMMPVGLLASGLLVRLTDGPFARETALVTPFFAAALGTAILAALTTRKLLREFARQSAITDR